MHNKTCPLHVHDGVTCRGEKCAWWETDAGSCVIILLAKQKSTAPAGTGNDANQITQNNDSTTEQMKSTMGFREPVRNACFLVRRNCARFVVEGCKVTNCTCNLKGFCLLNPSDMQMPAEEARV